MEGGLTAMRELSREEFARAASLGGEDRPLSVQPWAVIQGYNPGRVFVDSELRPSWAVVWIGESQRFYLLGDPCNWRFNRCLGEFFAGVIAPEATGLGRHWCQISASDCRWNRVIETAFSNRNLTRSQQVVFLYPDSPPPEQPGLPPGFRWAEVAEMRSAIRRQWGAQAASSPGGYGYCAVCDKEVASICFVYTQTHHLGGLGIETRAEHRQKGLGRAAAAATVREVLSRGKQPHWNCSAGNLASIATARSVGFERRVWEYTCYRFRL
ncbi:MAG: GNAT family N-acetyltransferase [Bacillota bacterium]